MRVMDAFLSNITQKMALAQRAPPSLLSSQTHRAFPSRSKYFDVLNTVPT